MGSKAPQYPPTGWPTIPTIPPPPPKHCGGKCLYKEKWMKLSDMYAALQAEYDALKRQVESEALNQEI